ncbi:MAG: hypothetical protein MUP74_04950, partial [Desulfobacterales bacterium]|nr:hypothetical protein [Desulfobacterales bacterium]
MAISSIADNSPEWTMSAPEWESPTRKRVRNRKVLHTTTAKPCDSDYFNPINIGVIPKLRNLDSCCLSVRKDGRVINT